MQQPGSSAAPDMAQPRNQAPHPQGVGRNGQMVAALRLNLMSAGLATGERDHGCDPYNARFGSMSDIWNGAGRNR